jgi:S-DNA-T family DNA segregation ATPase FtsK/SpoIIIE
MQQVVENNDGVTHVFMIYGIEGFLGAFSSEDQRKVKTFISNTKNHKNVRFIIADAVSKIKTIEYEDFYRNCAQPIYAVWVGSGITDQFTIKSSTYNRETRGQIPNDFGYNVDRGQAKNIKILDFYTEEL